MMYFKVYDTIGHLSSIMQEGRRHTCTATSKLDYSCIHRGEKVMYF